MVYATAPQFRKQYGARAEAVEKVGPNRTAVELYLTAPRV